MHPGWSPPQLGASKVGKEVNMGRTPNKNAQNKGDNSGNAPTKSGKLAPKSKKKTVATVPSVTVAAHQLLVNEADKAAVHHSSVPVDTNTDEVNTSGSGNLIANESMDLIVLNSSSEEKNSSASEVLNTTFSHIQMDIAKEDNVNTNSNSVSVTPIYSTPVGQVDATPSGAAGHVVDDGRILINASIQGSRTRSLEDINSAGGRKRTFSPNTSSGSEHGGSPDLTLAPYQRLQSENSKLKSNLEKLQAEYNAFRNSVADGNLVLEGVLLKDELRDTKSKLDGSLAQVRELFSVRSDLLKQIRKANEDCEEIRRELQAQIDSVKLQNEKLISANEALIKEVEKLGGRIGSNHSGATSHSAQVSEASNSLSMDTIVNGVKVAPNRNVTDTTLLAGRNSSLRDSRLAVHAGSLMVNNDGLPQRASRNVITRSISAVESIAGGRADSVASRSSVASVCDMHNNPNDSDNGSNRRKKNK